MSFGKFILLLFSRGPSTAIIIVKIELPTIVATAMAENTYEKKVSFYN